jgi:hypothetical protein
MATSTTGEGATQRPYSRGAVYLTATAGILMVMAGIFQAIQGMVALFNNEFFVVGEEYVFEFDVARWGWVHLVLGIVVAAAGAALFVGELWARVLAVGLACLSIIVNFTWLPYYPLWSLVVIAFNVFVIWALTAHGRDIADS